MSYVVTFEPIGPEAPACDVQTLTSMARSTFSNTFTHYKSADLDAYLDEYLSLETIRSELADPTNGFRFVLLDGVRTGYLKWQAPTTRYRDKVKVPGKRPFLLDKLYFLQEHQGQGLGPIALAYILSFARYRAAADFVYLSVWERNYRAQKFYQEAGFRTIGSFRFPVGEALDLEFLYGMAL